MNTSFKFTTKAIAIGFALLFSLNSCKENEVMPDTSSEFVKPIITNALKAKADILIGGKSDNIFDYYSSKELANELIAEIGNRRSYLLSEANLSFKAYKATILVNEPIFANNMLIVRCIEQLELTTNQIDLVSNELIVTKEAIPYEFQLVADGNTWKIVSEMQLNSFGDAVVYPQSKAEETTEEKVKQLKAASYTWNGTKSKDWAITYVGDVQNQTTTGYSPAFRKYSQDCANFASQCLKAGGWSYVGAYSGATNTNNWWYSTNATTGDTFTWKNANALNLFITNSGRGTLKTNAIDLVLGDILMADWARNYASSCPAGSAPTTTATCCPGADGVFDHSMIVTSKSATNIFVTYHTNNRLNKSFQDLKYEGKCRIGSGNYKEISFNRWNIK